MKWYTSVEVIDLETGEVLTKGHVERKEYRVISKEINKTKINENSGKVEIKWLTRRHEQTRMFD